MQKKWLCLLLSVMLLLLNTSALAQSDGNTFEPFLVNSIGHTAEEWFEETENRAMLTVLLALECTDYHEQYDLNSLYTNASYVAYDQEKEMIIVYLLEDEWTHTISYLPAARKAFITQPIAGSSQQQLELFFSLRGLEWEENMGESLSEAVASANRILEKINQLMHND